MVQWLYTYLIYTTLYIHVRNFIHTKLKILNTDNVKPKIQESLADKATTENVSVPQKLRIINKSCERKYYGRCWYIPLFILDTLDSSCFPIYHCLIKYYLLLTDAKFQTSITQQYQTSSITIFALSSRYIRFRTVRKEISIPNNMAT